MKKKALFNPLDSTFCYEWKDNENKVHNLCMMPIAITYFEENQAGFMAKHLCDEVMNVRGYDKNTELQRKAIMKEIMVDL